MKALLYSFFFSFMLITSCVSHKKMTTSVPKGNLFFAAEFHPFWGGSAICEIERKNGKDVLKYYYVEKINGIDSTTTAFVALQPVMADSVFKTIDRINWTQPIVDGKSDPKTGMKIDVRYKKGNINQQMHWERLSAITELPIDVQQVLMLMNALAPAEFKMY